MRKLGYILLYLMVISLGLPAQLTAAGSEDVQGTYCLLSKTTFKAKGLGKIVGTDDCYDELTLDAGGTFSLGPPTDPVTGTFYSDSKGKKIFLEFDSDGQEGLKDIFAQVISDLVWEKESVSISSDEIGIEFEPIKAFKIKIDKKTKKPTGSFKVKIKGIASAMVDDQPEQGKFSFQGKFTIGEPAGGGDTTTAIDWVFTSLLIERQGSTWVFYQRFAVTGPSGNVQITSTLKEASGGFAKLDDLTEQFYVEQGKEYEIAVSVDILGWGRCGPLDNDVMIFSSPAVTSEEDTLISPIYDPSMEPPGYKCVTQYSITDISVGLVP